MTVLLYLVFSTHLHAQPPVEWQKIYSAPGEDSLGQLFDVFATVDGGFAMTGLAATDSGNSSGVWLIVTDGDGNVEHEGIYPGGVNAPRCEGYSIIQDDFGGYIIGGRDYENHRGGNFSVLRIDANGELVWMDNWGSGKCQGVIELKSGEIVACGFAGRDGVVGMVVKMDVNGNTIWEKTYAQIDQYYALRESENGLIVVGYMGALTAISFLESNGDVIDITNYGNGTLRSIVSCDGGFAVSGGRQGNFRALKINHEGEQIWQSEFEVRESSTAIAGLPDGGFILTGGATQGHHNVRIDRAGNFMWQSDMRLNQNQNSPGWQSIITDSDGFSYCVGSINHQVGVLMKVKPDISSPIITEYTPSETDFTIIIEDTIMFGVTVVDFQEDSIWFSWVYEDNELDEQSPELLQYFQDLGLFSVTCIVADSTGADSVTWHVTVTDLYVSAFTPDTLDLALRRGTSVDFSLDTIRYTDGAEPEILWTKTNLSNGQTEETGSDAGASIDFPWSGEYSVEGRVSRGESSDAVTWHVLVKGAIWAYVPVDDSLEVLPDSVVHFEVVPSEPEDESLDVSWLVDGELVREGEMSLDWVFGVADSSADLNRHYLVQCVVADSVEADTVGWVVEVRPLSSPRDPAVAALPVTALLEVSPNPFNSTLTIRYATGGLETAATRLGYATGSQAAPTRLGIYDIAGREVANLLGSTGVSAGQEFHPVSAGRGFHPAAEGGATEHQITWDASAIPAGVYFVRLQAGLEIVTRKVVLMR